MNDSAISPNLGLVKSSNWFYQANCMYCLRFFKTSKQVEKNQNTCRKKETLYVIRDHWSDFP